jgi:hypothetical protein
MRPFKFMTPEADRPGSRLQPERRGAALIKGASIFFPDNRGRKQGVHDFDSGLDPSSNHKTLLSAKLDQVRLDGEPHESSGLVPPCGTAAVIDARDEFAECQVFFPAVIFHVLKYKSPNRQMPWGVLPMEVFLQQTVIHKMETFR